MQQINISTWNAQSLNDKIKVKRAANLWAKQKANILCIQETHLKKSTIPVLKTKWFSQQFQASGTSKARGTAILISKNLPFHSKKSRNRSKG